MQIFIIIIPVSHDPSEIILIWWIAAHYKTVSSNP